MNPSSFKEKDLQSVIGWILRAGVLISMSVVIVGGVLFLYRHGQGRADYHEFTGVPAFVHSPQGIINGILELRGQAIIQAGIVLLIATPIVRVIFSAIGFVLERDYLYVGITMLVLLVIVMSMLSGHAG
ncbi:DUF1634 domain-containing protein [Mucilaginibacter terrenus]|nr:DUF1634 domain-containing protein [Mucilaginibacter terrenus]